MFDWEYSGTGDPIGIVNQVYLETEDSVTVSLGTGRFYALDDVKTWEEKILEAEIYYLIIEFPDCSIVRYPKGNYPALIENPHCTKER